MRFFRSIKGAVTFCAVVFLGLCLFSTSARGQRSLRLGSPTGFYPYTIALPQDRSWIRSLPIEQRPARPLHFYGNRVRENCNVEDSYTVRGTNRNVIVSRPLGPMLLNPRRR